MSTDSIKHYDYLVIGGGSGGVASSRRAASYGAKTLLIEGKVMGGTCVNVGCVPKKVMWYAADLADRIGHAHGYGLYENLAVGKQNLTFNWKMFKDKRDAYVKRLNRMYENNLDREGVEYIYGWARFNKSGQVVVTSKDGSSEQVFSADKILIATGGTPVKPTDIPGYEHGIDSDAFFELKEQPKKVVIVGSGYIGTEFAGVFNALGTETHMAVRQQHLLTQFDNSIQETITEYYEKNGITIHKETIVSKVEKVSETGKLQVFLNDGTTLQDVDQLIWTIGRKSLLGLGLQNVGVKLNDNDQIIVDEFQNTNIPGLYSLGDVVGNVELTPVAIATGRKLSNRLFGPAEFREQKQDFTNVPSVVFSHPEVGTIGLTESEAIEQYGKDNIKVYNSKFVGMYYAMLEKKPPISYKLIVQGPEEKIIGLHMIGDSSAEILQGFAVAIKMGATKQDFDSCVAIHPTSAEELVTLR